LDKLKEVNYETIKESDEQLSNNLNISQVSSQNSNKIRNKSASEDKQIIKNPLINSNNNKILSKNKYSQRDIINDRNN